MSKLNFSEAETAAAERYFSSADRMEVAFHAASEADNENIF